LQFTIYEFYKLEKSVIRDFIGMPVTKQAIKKVRQDKRKAVYNARKRRTYKETVKDYLKKPTAAALQKAFSALDRAAKVNIIHKNKASRLKAQLSKKLSSAKPKKVVATAKKSPKS